MSRRLLRIHELAHQFRAFQQKRHIEARDFDNEALLLQDFVIFSYPEVPQSARHHSFPPDWALSRSSLHQAVLEFFRLTDSEGIPTSTQFIDWSREPRTNLQSRPQPLRPLGRRSRSTLPERPLATFSSVPSAFSLHRSPAKQSDQDSESSPPPLQPPSTPRITRVADFETVQPLNQGSPSLDLRQSEERLTDFHISSPDIQSPASSSDNPSTMSANPNNPNGQSPNDGANAGFSPTQLNQIQQLITAALASASPASNHAPGPPGPPGPQGEPGLQGQPGSVAPGHWKTDDVGYFNPDLSGTEPIVAVGTSTYYRDVFVFIDRLRDVVQIKGADIVRLNIQAALRGSALEWFTSELTEFEKKSLRILDPEQGWFESLINRFKPRPSEAMRNLEASSYSFRDVRAGRSARAFAQAIFRHARAAHMSSVFQQLIMAWNKIEPGLRRDIPEPNESTTISQFLLQLESKAGIWQDLAASFTARNQTRQPYTPQTNRTQWQPTRPQSSRFPPRRLPSSQAPQAPEPQSQGQRLITDRPWNSGSETSNNRPFAPVQPGQRATAYIADEPESTEPISAEETALFTTSDQDLPATDPVEEYDQENDPIAWFTQPVQSADSPIFCFHCQASFLSNNQLHRHIREQRCTLEHELKSPFFIHAKPHKTPAPSGYAFRGKRYVSAQVSFEGLYSSQNHTICLDTGCTMSLIDAPLARTLQLPILPLPPINVAGVANGLQSSEYMVLPLLFSGLLHGRTVTARVPVEVHLVPVLQAKLLLGTDVMDAHDMTISLPQKHLIIGSCEDVVVPISASPENATSRCHPVYSTKTIRIPPRSQAIIPTLIKKELPAHANFIYEPSPTIPGIAHFTHLVDANFSFVPVFNPSTTEVQIQRKAKIGNISPANFETAYEAHPLTDLPIVPPSDASRWPSISVPPSLNLHVEQSSKEAELPNGIHIYGDDYVVEQLQQVVEAYPIWGQNEGFVNISPEDWMEIPLVDGWERRLPRQKIYKQGPKERAFIDQTYDKLRHLNRLSPVTGHCPTAWPTFVVYRTVINEDGTSGRKGRAVVDLRGLNALTQPDRYPLPTQDDILGLLEGKRFITVVDAAKMFHQWPVKHKHRNRLAVVTHRGQECFNVAIMGYINSVPYVQRHMDFQLHEFLAFCRAYIDDIVIASATLAEHILHLHLVFQKLTDLNLTLEPAKAYIGYPSVKLLGQRVDGFGMSTLQEKTQAIADLHFPTTLHQLESYLGMTSALRHYIKDYAHLAAPLEDRKTTLLKGAPVKGKPRRQFASNTRVTEILEAEQEAFNTLQSRFTARLWLAHFSRSRQLYVDIDSSKQSGHGAVVFHSSTPHDDFTRPPPAASVEPIMFLSRRLTLAERNYWPTELEVSCLVWVTKKIRHLVESTDQPAIIYTDHASTVDITKQASMNTTSVDRLNLRLVRASLYLQQFHVRCYHKPGATNIIADAISRLPTKDNDPSTATDLDTLDLSALYAQLKHRPSRNPYLQTDLDELDPSALCAQVIASTVQLSPEFKEQILQAYQTDSHIRHIQEQLAQAAAQDPIQPKLPYIQQDDGLVFTRRPNDEHWLVIPRSIAPIIFKAIHDDAGHQGFDRCYASLKGYSIQRGAKLLKDYIRHCPVCLRTSTRRHKPYGSLQPILSPAVPFHTLTMDFITGLPRSKNDHDAIMLLIDKYSKRHGLMAGCSDWTADQWGIGLIAFLQTGDWGIPVVFITDRDPKFLSNIWSAIFNALQVRHLYTTAYHPQTDGQSERAIQTIEIMYRHISHMYPDLDWEDLTPSIQWRLNGSPNATTGHSPHRLLFGMDLRQPWALFRQIPHQDFSTRYDAEQALHLASSIMKKAYDSRHIHMYFNVGDSVFVRLLRGYNIAANATVPRKFAQRYAGPFRVLERVGRLAYKLDIPSTWNIHPVISVALLEPAPKDKDPFDRQLDEPGPTFDDRYPEDTDRYDIDRILARRTRPIGRNATLFTEYLVRWQGFNEAHDEWIRKEHLDGAEQLVNDFDASHPS